MASEKVDAQTAFTRLRRQARNTRRSLPEVVREVIDGVWAPRIISDHPSLAAATRSPAQKR
jgi:hypothetical protein